MVRLLIATALLAIVLGVLVLRRGGASRVRAIRVTARTTLHRGAVLAIVEVDGRRLLVGAGGQQVNLLADLGTAPEPPDASDDAGSPTAPAPGTSGPPALPGLPPATGVPGPTAVPGAPAGRGGGAAGRVGPAVSRDAVPAAAAAAATSFGTLLERVRRATVRIPQERR